MLIVVNSPLLLILAVLVRLDSAGPVLYSEKRYGLAGKCFRLYKFRTLCRGDGGAGLVAPSGDERITRVGSWLRPTHLDELPQLFNILRGEMHFVGPRPARPELWTGVDPHLRERALAFPPGLTSPASIRFICEDAVLAEFDMPETLYRDIIYPAKVAVDVRHFENRKRFSDLRVIAATLAAVLRQRDDSNCRRRLGYLLAQSPGSDNTGEKGTT